MTYDIGVFGGDMRQIWIGKMLAEAGYRVTYYGMCEEEAAAKEDTASSFLELLESADILVGPILLTRDKRNINHQSNCEDMTMAALKRALAKGKRLIAGCLPAVLTEQAYNCHDFMKQDSFVRFNSIATAEGAIVRAISEGPGNISGSRCFVLGYGICASALADRLAGLKARVTVCAKRREIRTQAQVDGYDSCSFADLTAVLKEADYIFNTVPAPVIRAEELAVLRVDTVIIDIASAPGGVDYQAAAELGVQARLCPGLPGIYAPKASSEAMVKEILDIL